MRRFWKVNVFLGDHIADYGQPGVQLIRNTWLHNASLRDNFDSFPCVGMSVVLPLWVSGNGPSLGLI